MPQDQLRSEISLLRGEDKIDQATAIVLKRRLAEDFRNQLTTGIPTNEDEAGLRRVATQITSNKLVIKLYLRHPLHAKLYLHFRPGFINPIIGYMGSSNFMLASLAKQGELNIDILEPEACNKLAKWFEDRWNDRFCLDISKELVEIINTSWARHEPISPYHIYVKMAYHLAQEARAGLKEFIIPADFGNTLFEFQKAAVKVAAYHLSKRGGVVIGDVVGLGKTLMATALARIFEDDLGVETLIICPKNLVLMWEDYCYQYRLRAKVISVTSVQATLPSLRRYRLVLIDESHNLRNRNGKRYRSIAQYIMANDSRVILLSATPYNKTYLDLSNQLRLFIDENEDIGVRPERLLRELGETEFIRRHQCPVRSLAAFEKSGFADDWRDLMRLYLVRRTRSFIQDNYAKIDAKKNRKYLEFADGTRSYFPIRVPKTVKFIVDPTDANDQYAQLFAEEVLKVVNNLKLPRYGLGNYLKSLPHKLPTADEGKVLADLSRAGARLKGFCRTNIFKRLESSGHVFVLSLERHVLRNFIYLHAIENDLSLPIGTQDIGLLDSWSNDEDSDLSDPSSDGDDDELLFVSRVELVTIETDYKMRAKRIYDHYAKQFCKRFKWLSPSFFKGSLENDLRADAKALTGVLKQAGAWDPDRDLKLAKLIILLNNWHPNDKVLIFTQFADTVEYLASQLRRHNIISVADITGNSADPTNIAHRFSPVSNNKRNKILPTEELRVVVATDVLSEGQNLQDCAIIVNYDLPWAIIRLIQRAGRIDRIGQQADKITCYSFLPAEGVERIINLRSRVRQRLKENSEVVGTDETFFDDEKDDNPLLDIYHEKSGILDGEEDTDNDLSSTAYEIWKHAIQTNPNLKKIIEEMPNNVYSAKAHQPVQGSPDGALVYVKTTQGTDALAWVDTKGRIISESQHAILKVAACSPSTPAVPHHNHHHEMVAQGVKVILEAEKSIGGQLGRPSGARFRTYEYLKTFASQTPGTIAAMPELNNAINDIYRYPLLQSAADALNRQLKIGSDNLTLAELVISLRKDSLLSLVTENDATAEPQVICSLGLTNT